VVGQTREKCQKDHIISNSNDMD